MSDYSPRHEMFSAHAKYCLTLQQLENRVRKYKGKVGFQWQPLEKEIYKILGRVHGQPSLSCLCLNIFGDKKEKKQDQQPLEKTGSQGRQPRKKRNLQNCRHHAISCPVIPLLLMPKYIRRNTRQKWGNLQNFSDGSGGVGHFIRPPFSSCCKN